MRAQTSSGCSKRALWADGRSRGNLPTIIHESPDQDPELLHTRGEDFECKREARPADPEAEAEIKKLLDKSFVKQFSTLAEAQRVPQGSREAPLL